MKKILTISIFIIATLSALAVSPSGTLPIMYINTSSAITSTENYISATFYIDALSTGYASTGSADSPIDMKIRGRGNSSWTNYDKKPYRFKLNSGIKLLGMPKSKNYCLLAHADDQSAFLRNTLGYKASQLMNLAYTPDRRAIELVLNGEYIGVYFLNETVRIDKDRVAITKQNDNETDASLITGGWLLEIDNADDPAQVKISEGNGNTARFNYKDPEELSSAQTTYLTNQLNAINSAVYTADKNSTEWQNLVNIDTLARFYIVHELLDNIEAFNCNTYLYKQRGEQNIWSFGPVWDFSNAYRRTSQQFIYQNNQQAQVWIAEIVKFPAFQAKVKELWVDFYANKYPLLNSHIDSFVSTMTTAIATDYQRWPAYGTANAATARDQFKGQLAERATWLNDQWTKESNIENIGLDNIAPAEYYNLQGLKIDNPANGLYIKIQNGQASKVLLK